MKARHRLGVFLAAIGLAGLSAAASLQAARPADGKMAPLIAKLSGVFHNLDSPHGKLWSPLLGALLLAFAAALVFLLWSKWKRKTDLPVGAMAAAESRAATLAEALQPLASRLDSVEADRRSQDERFASFATWRDGMDAGLQSLARDLQALDGRLNSTVVALTDVERKLPPDLVPHISALQQRVGALEVVVRTSPPAPPPAGTPIDLERNVLDEIWKPAQENLTAVLESALQDGGWQEVQSPLLVELPNLVPEELKTSLQTVLAPAKDYYNLIAKLALVPKVLAGELPPLASDVQEIKRLRELAQLLTMIQISNLVADRLRFRLRIWIADHFLGFADLLLQRYQQAQLEGRVGTLAPAVEIARRVLALADLLPIELALGRTPFDSTRHIGRSTTRDPNFSDGVILGVVRNGFLRGGREVIRQPEVIVNRVR